MEFEDVTFAPSAIVHVTVDDQLHEVLVHAHDDACELIQILLRESGSDIAPGSTVAVDLERKLHRVVLALAKSEASFYRQLAIHPMPQSTSRKHSDPSHLRINVTGNSKDVESKIATAKAAAAAAAAEGMFQLHGDEEFKSEEDESLQEALAVGPPVAGQTQKPVISTVGSTSNAACSSPMSRDLLRRKALRQQVRLHATTLVTDDTDDGDDDASSTGTLDRARTRSVSKAEENYEAYMSVVEARSSPRRNNDVANFWSD